MAHLLLSCCAVQWKLGETKVVKETGDISTDFILEDNDATRAVWSNSFTLTLTVLLKPTSLSLQLRVLNRNEDGRPFDFTALLHTYLHVEAIERTSVRGLQYTTYVDQLDGNKLKEQRSESVIFSGEVRQGEDQRQAAQLCAILWAWATLACPSDSIVVVSLLFLPLRLTRSTWT